MIQKQKGTRDIVGNKAKYYRYIENIFNDVMEKYNYKYIRTPIFEATELFTRSVGDTSDIVTKEMYTFEDKGGRSITLRPEGTAGVIRSYVENKMYVDNKLCKLYYFGPMYRYERPQKGRYREFTQFGFEAIGSNDPLMDVDVIACTYNLYKMLGLKNIKVVINSLGDKESRDNYRNALIEYFKPYMKDLCEDCNNRLENNPLRILDCKIDSENPIMKKAPNMIEYLNEDSKKRFDKVKEYLEYLNINFEVDSTLVRGLDYYEQTVFEIKLDGSEQGSLGGGGRYNNLVKELGGPDTPCVGFAAGVDRIMEELVLNDIEVPDKEIDAFIMYVNEDEEKYAEYLVNDLRMNGFNVETEYVSKNLKAEFKQADKLNAKYLIILNSADLENNEVRIKNNSTKEEEIVSIDVITYFLEEKLNDVLNDIDIEEFKKEGDTDD